MFAVSLLPVIVVAVAVVVAIVVSVVLVAAVVMLMLVEPATMRISLCMATSHSDLNRIRKHYYEERRG